MSTNQVNAPEVTAAAASVQDDATSVASSAGLPRYSHCEQAADQAAVQSIFGPGSGFHYRHNFGGRHGQWLLTVNPLFGVTPRSRVFVSISEGLPGGPEVGKFIGAARYTVHNVAARTNAVDILVDIDWNSDILVYVDYFVYNP